jgi:hypothetical protein
MRVAARAFDLEAGAFHGCQMRAARDEGDVGARLRQRRTESAPDATSADHCNLHPILPTVQIRVEMRADIALMSRKRNAFVLASWWRALQNERTRMS